MLLALLVGFVFFTLRPSHSRAAEEDLEAGAYTRSLSAQLEPCLTHEHTLHTLNTP